jgi:hypothetical protein
MEAGMEAGLVTIEQFTAEGKSESVASNRGHALSGWHLVTEQLYMAVCLKECGAMAWVTHPGDEEFWRVGGTALEQACFGYRGVPGETSSPEHPQPLD